MAIKNNPGLYINRDHIAFRKRKRRRESIEISEKREKDFFTARIDESSYINFNEHDHLCKKT